jgi:hypothetical protein
VFKIVQDLLQPVENLESEAMKNFLLQHSTGSGKSLTIACLTYCLYLLRVTLLSLSLRHHVLNLTHTHTPLGHLEQQPVQVQQNSCNERQVTRCCCARLRLWFGLAVLESGSDRRRGIAHRKILDEQLGDTVLDFLSANGIGDVQRSKSSDHLAALMLADRPRVIITTMQKFIKLGKVL